MRNRLMLLLLSAFLFSAVACTGGLYTDEAARKNSDANTTGQWDATQWDGAQWGE